jgi:hypothetical protein
MSAIARLGGKFFEKSGLTHPCIPVERYNVPLGVDRSQSIAKGIHLVLAVEQVIALRRDRRSGLDASPETWCRWEVLVEDRLVQLGGLIERRDTQFMVEDGYEVAICLDGARPVAGPGIQQHEEAMRRLVELIEFHPSCDGGDRPWIVPCGGQRHAEAMEGFSRLQPQSLGDCPLPIFEFGCIPDREPLEEVTAIEIGRLVKRTDAFGTHVCGLVAMLCRGG